MSSDPPNPIWNHPYKSEALVYDHVVSWKKEPEDGLSIQMTSGKVHVPQFYEKEFVEGFTAWKMYQGSKFRGAVSF